MKYVIILAFVLATLSPCYPKGSGGHSTHAKSSQFAVSTSLANSTTSKTQGAGKKNPLSSLFHWGTKTTNEKK